MARRVKSLHHNLQDGKNVVYHREHRSPRNRAGVKKGRLQKWKRSKRRGFKNLIKSGEFKNDMDKLIRYTRRTTLTSL